MMRLFLCVILFGAVSTAKELRQAEREIVYVLKRVRPAVVTVITPNKRDHDITGVVVASNGVILTLRSPLLDSAKRLPAEVSVRIAGAKRIEVAHVIDEDQGTNTVLLLTRSATNRAVKLGRVADARIGEWALLVGNTFGAGRESTPSASLGVVSGTVRAGGEVVNLHISALVNPGSNGAPVFDGSGLLLGIVAPTITAAGGQTMVVPIDRIRAAYRQKRTPGRRVFRTSNTPKRDRRSFSSDYGMVIAAAVAAAKSSLVGVRSAPDGDDTTPPSTPPVGKRKRSRVSRVPARVRGMREAWDRSSGLIVDSDGLILCPLRVTGWPAKQRRMVVDLLDGTSFKATILGTDERLRLALLRIDRKGLPAMRTAPRDTVRSGRFAIALGYPHENPDVSSPQVTVGILSRTGALDRVHPMMRALQTDAGVSGGNRGGPLIDIDGNILGVIMDVNETNSQGYDSRKWIGAYAGNAGLGFAIPTSVIEEILPRLKKGESLRPVLLGIRTRGTKEGLLVASVSAKDRGGQPTAAASVGLKKGDTIIQLAGQAMRRTSDLTRALARCTVGDVLEIVWLRAGKRMEGKLKLGPR